jgi:Protein of unknown function (DUF3619)
MNEDDLARRIVHHLGRSLEDVPPDVSLRLHAAREEALRHARADRQAAGRPGGWGSGHHLMVRLVLPVALVGAIAAGLYWQSVSQNESLEVETALLADELPIHAYTDPGFDTWLRHSSYEQR